MFSLVLTACLVAATFAHDTLSTSDIQGIVNLSNQIRGETGTSMPNLSWDPTLANFAAQRADLCNFQHTPNNQYGENLFWSSVAHLAPLDAVDQALRDWASEKKNVINGNWACITNFNEGQTCGHYSQQVWAKTTKIGCGLNTACTGEFAGTYVVCEYSPAGNVEQIVFGNDGQEKIIMPKPY